MHRYPNDTLITTHYGCQKDVNPIIIASNLVRFDDDSSFAWLLRQEGGRNQRQAPSLSFALRQLANKKTDDGRTSFDRLIRLRRQSTMIWDTRSIIK
jgi:hypothetical protein